MEDAFDTSHPTVAARWLFPLEARPSSPLSEAPSNLSSPSTRSATIPSPCPNDRRHPTGDIPPSTDTSDAYESEDTDDDADFHHNLPSGRLSRKEKLQAVV